MGLIKYKYGIEQYEVTLCELFVKPLEELDVVHINTMWTQRYHQSCPLKSKSTSADQNSQGSPFAWRASCFSGSYNIYEIPTTAGLRPTLELELPLSEVKLKDQIMCFVALNTEIVAFSSTGYLWKYS